jgi:arginyl-tRNA synthetase
MCQEVARWSNGDEKVNEIVKNWQIARKDKDRRRAFNDLIQHIPSGETKSKLLAYDIKSPDPELVKMLDQWESGDPMIRDLWKIMNDWVYDGFLKTKPRYGFTFDRVYFESQFYTLGKDQVLEGARKGVFVKDATGALFYDLPVQQFGTNQDGKPHRHKVLNAPDGANPGTSVYLTQDIGIAIVKASELELDRSIYVVGNEQDPHFDALFSILEALGFEWAKKCCHVSYAMVELPEGKMKSRTGKVVDADDLADEVVMHASDIIRSNRPNLPEAEIRRRAEIIGMAAIKFYLTRPAPTTTIAFDPKKGLSLDGDTGPYCLYTYARTRSLLAKGAKLGYEGLAPSVCRLIGDDERVCMLELISFPEGVRSAAESYAPSIVADRLLRLCGTFNRFYKNNQVLSDDADLRNERLSLVELVSQQIQWGLSLLGIETIDEM